MESSLDLTANQAPVSAVGLDPRCLLQQSLPRFACYLKCFLGVCFRSLHYFEAFLREAMRLDTLVPLSLAHRATEDTTFRGFYIPKVSVLQSRFKQGGSSPWFK